MTSMIEPEYCRLQEMLQWPVGELTCTTTVDTTLTRLNILILKFLQHLIELANGVMKHHILSSNTTVDRDNVPRGHQQTVEFGKC